MLDRQVAYLIFERRKWNTELKYVYLGREEIRHLLNDAYIQHDYNGKERKFMGLQVIEVKEDSHINVG